MYVGTTLFEPWTSLARIVQRHGGNSGVRTLSCAEQFRAMAFTQLTWRERLRDIETTLSANASNTLFTSVHTPTYERRRVTSSHSAVAVDAAAFARVPGPAISAARSVHSV